MRSTIIANVKIAVVDHDALTRDFIVNVMMYSVNRHVIGFENARDFLKHLESAGDVDLVLAEIRLPGENGFELLKHLKKVKPATRFIALSSKAVDEDYAHALGADAFLAKPFLLKDLFAIVEHFVVEDEA
ncbi:MAG: response regulator [Desulfosarcinaceae bacterium]